MSKPPVPEAVLNQHSIALGKTRAGKSSKMRVLVEWLLDHELPTVIIDIKGDWWGLKSSQDGKRPGYPIVIFGGPHADVPLNHRAGAHVAELVATGNRPCIIDISTFTVAEYTRFFIDFASTFFLKARGRRWLVLDEVQNFAPQGKVYDPEAGKMLHWAKKLASEGSGRNILILSASQRPQKVHKDFVTSCETLIACRVIHPLDRAVIADWIDGCPDREKGQQVLSSLAQMERKHAWVWSPEIKFGPELVEWPLFKTYDSFKAQEGDVDIKLKGWAEVDLADVTAKLGEVVKEAEANDPKKLRATIADLQRQLAAKHRPLVAVDPGSEGRWIQTTQRLQAENDQLRTLADNLRGALRTGAASLLDFAKANPAPKPGRARSPRSAAPSPVSSASTTATRSTGHTSRPSATVNGSITRRSSSAGAAVADGELSGPERLCLTAFAWFKSIGIDAPTKEQVCFRCGWRPTSGHIKNVLGSLRSAGHVDGLSITDQGASMVTVDEAGSLEEYHQQIRSFLDGPQRLVFDNLLSLYPAESSREAVCEALGWSVESGHIKNVMGKLRSFGVVAKRGWKLTDMVFPEGLS